MIVAVSLAIAHALGVDIRRLLLLAVAVYAPLAVVVIVAVLVWLGRRVDDRSPALFCETVASELRAGANLRDAITTAQEPFGATSPSPVESERPLGDVAAAIAERFPSIGEELRQTIVRASRSGSDVASLFDEIGSLALAQTEVRREVRMAIAPGRATALLLVGAPTLYLTAQAMSGNVEQMLRSGGQRIAAVLGLGLFLVGVAATCLVIWRAGR